jgi:proteasome activator subunit 4
VNPEETLRMLLPHLCDTVLSLVESDDILEEEILDNELLYNLLLLSEVSSATNIQVSNPLIFCHTAL